MVVCHQTVAEIECSCVWNPLWQLHVIGHALRLAIISKLACLASSLGVSSECKAQQLYSTGHVA